MNSQFIAGQPPPNMYQQQQQPPPPSFNGAAPNQQQFNQAINQKMQSLNLGPNQMQQFPQTQQPQYRPPSNVGPQSMPPMPSMPAVPPSNLGPQPMPPSMNNGAASPPGNNQPKYPPSGQPGPPGPPGPPINQQQSYQSQAPPPRPGQNAPPMPHPGMPSAGPGHQGVKTPPGPNYGNQFPGNVPPTSASQPGFPPMAAPQPGFPPTSAPQPGFPPMTASQPGFPPTAAPQPGFPPMAASQPGFPPTAAPQSGFPPTSAIQPGFPPMSAPQPGFPPQPGYPKQQPPGIPNQQPGFPNQQPGFPNQPPGLANQQLGFPPAQQPGFTNQQPQFPNQPPQFPNQPAGFQNQQPGYGGQPGYPGQPGQQAAYPGQQNQYGYQQQQKKLNPDQMPSPIQVMTDDQNSNGGVFATSAKGRVPPLVTTDFVVVDQGNASPRYIRSSMYSVPVNNDMMKQIAVPFCVVVSPMAEEVEEEQAPPLLDFSVLTGIQGTGPIRCGRCKAYMCPAMRFVDAGRHFQCAFCKATTEVPMEYTQYLNNAQQYGQGTPEMSLGCYEIVATKEYCRNNVLPNPPAMIFVIDVSYNAVRSGMLQLVVGNLRTMLSNLQTPPRIGIITYSSTIHFYNINQNLGQPQMLVVGDIQDVFVPFSHGLLAEPGQADHLLDALAQQIPLMFKDNKETETILLPAVQAGLEALKAADCVGKLLVFHCSLPTAQAPGQLANRDDRKLLGTDKERNILNPQTKVYNEVAQECVGAGCGVELFLFNNAYVDLATIGQLARLTGGGVYKYTYFQAEFDSMRVIRDLNRVLSRPTAYDAVMRVRTSTGVRATDFYGHFFMSNTTDVELATLDSDKAIAVEIKHDDKLTGEDGVYVQVALLYTHVTGQRRLRICNLALGVANQMADLYRSCDLDTFINFLTKQAISRLSEHSPKTIKEGIIQRCAQSLAAYRKHCANPSSVGQLVLPESMKLLPLYANCLLRSDALSGGQDMTCDDRSWAMQSALCADVNTSVVMLYPRLLCLNPLASGIPAEPLRCTIDKLRDDSIFLLENSIHMMMWIGLQAPSDLVKNLFGVNTVAEINTEVTELPELKNEFNEAIRELIDQIRTQRNRCMRLTLVRQHDKLEMVFRHFLVEDEGRNGASSYMDFLCHVHKEIRSLL